MKTKIIAIISMMLLISLPLSVTAQENIIVIEHQQQFNEMAGVLQNITDELKEPECQGILNQVSALMAPYVTSKIQAEAEAQGAVIENMILTLDYDFGDDVESLAQSISELFILVFILCKLLFGQILGEWLGVLCCGLLYLACTPIAYLYSCNVVLFIFADNFLMPENEEYFTLAWWIFSCGIFIGPVVWIIFITVVLCIALPICLIGGIPMCLLYLFPVWNRSLQLTYDYFTG